MGEEVFLLQLVAVFFFPVNIQNSFAIHILGKAQDSTAGFLGSSAQFVDTC